MGDKLKVICELNGCSDCHGRQYPECDIRPIKQPSICPKREEVRKALNPCGATPSPEFCKECKSESEDEAR